MPRVVIIRNPAARRAIAVPRLEAAAAQLDARWVVEIRDTRDADGPTVLGRHVAESGADYVLACGGDGTLNGVVNGVLASGRPGVVVGLIPAGTANVWASEARVPSDPAQALALLDRGRVVQADLGIVRVGAEERRFLLMCSMGFDAAVVERVEQLPGLKRRLAQGAFVVAGAGVLARQRPVPLVSDWDPLRPERSLFIGVVGNSRLYGGVSRLTSAARLDDGVLDLALFEARPGIRGIGDALRHLGRGVLRGKRPWHQVQAPRFEYRQAGSPPAGGAAVAGGRRVPRARPGGCRGRVRVRAGGAAAAHRGGREPAFRQQRTGRRYNGVRTWSLRRKRRASGSSASVGRSSSGVVMITWSTW